MANIGLDKIFYAPITEDEDGEETYGTPVPLGGAISAGLSIETVSGMLYSDDGISKKIEEFKSGALTLGVDDIGKAVAAALVGARVDGNGVLISASEDSPSPVAVGFRSKTADGEYRYIWLYKVQFKVPSADFATKGEGIEFKTPTIEGTIMRRKKLDGAGHHPWKADVTSGETGVSASTISGWFGTVYEPSFTEGV